MPHSPATSRRCPYSLSKSTRLTTINPPSGTSRSASSRWSRFASLPAPWRSSPVLRWAKISPVLPIVTIARRSSAARSRSVPFGRFDRVVAAMVRAPERGPVGADEGTRDDAPDAKRIAESSCDAAEGVKPIEPERLLVSRDLKHAIGRRVADRAARPEMGLAECLDHGGARAMPVAEDAVEPGFGHEGSPRGRAGNRARRSENSPRPTGPACRRVPNGRRACPCRPRPPGQSPTLPCVASRRAPVRPGGTRPDAASAAAPSPRASRCGKASTPDLSPARSPRPAAQASAIWPSVSAPTSP